MNDEEQTAPVPSPAPEGEGAGGTAGLTLEAEAQVDASVLEGEQQPSPSGEDHARQLADLNERYIRLAADFENYRKRAQRERLEIQLSANEELVVELLPVVDNLERAIAAVKESQSDERGLPGVMKGVELTLKLFQDILGRYGVERIKATGEPFDPRRHEALMQEESAEVDADTVTEELEPGYTMHGKVVRPSRVKVVKPKVPVD